MDPSADASPEVSTPAFIKRATWHSKDVARIEVEVFRSCKGDFGIPKRHHSAPLSDSYGVPISNAIFLPPPGARLEDFHWDITGESGPPPVPDHRELWIHVTMSDEARLSSAQTPLELCIAIGHSMLGVLVSMCNFSALSKRMSAGWLSMLHRGFLHRDVGTPTVFRLSDPTEMTPFVPGNFEQALGETQAGEDDQILRDQVQRLQQAIADLGIASACCGVVQPSDMAVGMKDYYTSGGNTRRSVSIYRSHRPMPWLEQPNRTITSSCLLDC